METGYQYSNHRSKFITMKDKQNEIKFNYILNENNLNQV